MRNIWFCLLLVITTRSASADPHLDVETDPSGWVLDGYSVHSGYRPEALPNWRFELGTYGVHYPSVLVDLDAANKGWDVRIRRGVALQVAWYPRERRGGWFLAGSLALNQERDTLEASGMYGDRTTFGIMPQAGYQWFPFANQSFYIKPWAGLGVLMVKGHDVTIAGQTFDQAAFAPFATVHVGFEL
jgi:hypothetical protein